MAKDTQKSLRNKVIYEIYVRNHAPGGTFKDILEDLPRIKSLGTDIVWFMPIHPIGQKNKKGDLGCPYSITDYKMINSEYGTLEDFTSLTNAIHTSGMLVMIDVVYNHTAHDAVYLAQHPEYYYRKPNGALGNKVADWTDIIDLDYGCKALWEDQIEALEYWTKLGVDGFRCDVAPLVPLEFWLKARKRVQAINPKSIFLAETIHGHFVEFVRNEGFYAASDSEVFQAFDICYDYDTHADFHKYLKGEITLNHYLEKKRIQEYIYPENYVKLRYLENHDTPRITSFLNSFEQLKQWTAFMYFEKGTALIYAGQEAKDDKQPSLFDIDPINWSGLDDAFSAFHEHLSLIKKDTIYAEGRYKLHKAAIDGVILGTYMDSTSCRIGVFNVELKAGTLSLTSREEGYPELPVLKDGKYINLYTGHPVEVSNNSVPLGPDPILLRVMR